MKRIVLGNPSDEILPLSDLYMTTRDVVFYRATGAKVQLGVLIEDPARNEWGFIYHHRLIQLNLKELHFKSSTPGGSISHAINVGRIVQIAEYNEFIDILKESQK